jgi:hypothetical protein
MRHPDLRAPFRGVRVPGHLPDDLPTRCAAASLLLPPGSVLAGATAASLWGLPLPARLDPALRPGAVLQARVPAGAPRPEVRGIVVRAGVPDRPIRRRGLLLAEPSSAWADLGPALTVDELVVLGDAVARLDGTLRHLHARFEARRLPGRSRLAEALSLVREGVDSPQETRTRLLLVRAGVPEPEVNRDAYDGTGGWLGQIDLGWHAVKVALEYLGDVHRTARGRWRKDVRRREVLEDAGWKVLFVTADDLGPLRRDLVRRVTTALVDRGLRW